MTDSSPASSPAAGSGAAKSNWPYPGAILVATDLEDLDRLMPYAFQQADETGARLILLHVIPSAGVITADEAGMPYFDPAGASDHAAKTLEPWCEMAGRRKIVCDGLVREGNAAQQVVASARQFQADRVLLGTRSRSRLGKLLLGSVAEQVLRSVNLPVFTVGPEAHLPADSGERQRVVLSATTLRETSRPCAALACQIAANQAAKLVLMHVLPPVDEMQKTGQPTGLDSAAMHELRRLAEETGAGCCTVVEPHVVHGNPAIEILSEASERQATLIVLGATDRLAFETLNRERTIYRILAHARCPVLTLREPLAPSDEAEAEPLAVSS